LKRQRSQPAAAEVDNQQRISRSKPKEAEEQKKKKK
jgi:hypothetical protein